METTKNLLRTSTILLVALFAFSSAAAQEDGNAAAGAIWDTHFADHLPDYCKYTFALPDWRRVGEDEWYEGRRVRGLKTHPKAVNIYEPMFGRAWQHMHHYCFGLELVYQASVVRDPMVRRGKLIESVTQLEYVLNYGIDEWILRSEALFNIGLSYLNLDQDQQAVQYFTDALTVDPQYVPAYIVLSDFFERGGDVEEAALVLMKGLEHVPDSDVLAEELAGLQ